MLHENREQTLDARSSFIINHDSYEQFELLLPEPLSILDNLPEESNLELDDYFMELEINFDE
ncbi:MAG: hypothetical protein ABI954_01985 [Pyrinomonadaceae bacterium]